MSKSIIIDMNKNMLIYLYCKNINVSDTAIKIKNKNIKIFKKIIFTFSSNIINITVITIEITKIYNKIILITYFIIQ